MAPISSTHLREMLGNSELLRTIPEQELDALAGRVRRIQCARGQHIFARGDPGAGVMFLVRGRVKIVSVSPSGTEVIYNIIERGQIFGELALLDGKPRSADAMAAADSEIVELARRDFLEVLGRNPGMALAIIRILCSRIRQTTSFIEDAVLLDAETRLLHRLKAMAEQYGRHGPNGVTRIEHGLSQQEIGESVGLTRVSVNRVLAQWRERGLIEDGRGFIVINDLEALTRAVEKV